MATPGAGMAADIAEQPEVYARLLEPANADPIAAVARGDRRAPPAPRGLHRPRHVRPRRALRRLPHRDPPRPARRPRLAQRDHRLRRPARPVRRTRRRGHPERRLARPDRGAPGGPGARRAHPRRHQQPRLAAGRGRRAARSTSRAGHERAVAATKTYTAELLALLLLVEGVRAGDGALPRRRARGPRRAAGAGRGGRWPTTPPPSSPPRYRFAGAAGHHRPGVRLPDRPRGRAQADGDRRTCRRSPSPAPTCCTARSPWPTRTCRCSPWSAPGRAARRCARCSTRLGERRADVVTVGPDDVAGATARLPFRAVDERYAPAARHPAAAAAGAGPGARPRRGPGRTARPEEGHRDAVSAVVARWRVSTLRDLVEEHTAPAARPTSTTCTASPATGSCSPTCPSPTCCCGCRSDDRRATFLCVAQVRPTTAPDRVPGRPGRPDRRRPGGGAPGHRVRARAGSGGRATRSGTATPRPGTRRSRCGCARRRGERRGDRGRRPGHQPVHRAHARASSS